MINETILQYNIKKVNT